MPTILVADDNSNIQKMVSLVFEEKGIHVVAVGNGEAACRKVPEVRPDVVLADVFMPVRSGYEVCEFVKQDAQSSQTPVILLVGAFDPLDEKEARRVGADGILKKPFVPPEPLIAMVTGWLQKSDKPAAEPADAAKAPKGTASQQPVQPLESPQPVVSYGTEAVREEPSYATGVRNPDEGEVSAPFVGEPVATPSSHTSFEESDGEEPESEWQHRRAAMDYEISASQSASMVEDLAKEIDEPKSAQPHEPIAPAEVSQHFVPSAASEISEDDHEEWNAVTNTGPSAGTDSDTFGDSNPANGGTGTAPGDEEFAVPATEMASSAEPAGPQETNYYSGLGATESESSDRLAGDEEQKSDSGDPKKIGFSPYVDDEQGVDQPAAPENHFEESSSKTTSLGAPEVEDAAREFEPAPRPAASATSGAPSPALAKEVRQAVEETFLEHAESSGGPPHNAPVDSATVDTVVHKVLEKLEPRIHDILSQGLLRPLVEEMLARESAKK